MYDILYFVCLIISVGNIFAAGMFMLDAKKVPTKEIEIYVCRMNATVRHTILAIIFIILMMIVSLKIT